jgi:hypothetical protein
MPTENRNQHKVCHCTPNCNRLLGLSQRKHHYQLVDDPSTICRSTTPSDSEDPAPGIDNVKSDISENESAENMHIDSDGLQPYEDDMGDISDIEEVPGPLHDNYDDRDNGQESGDGFFDGKDDETWEYDPEDDFIEPLLSLDEMQETIEDEIGPGMDLEMWALRESCCNQ